MKDFLKALPEIQKQRRTVSFDSYDITIKQIVDMVSDKSINVSPEYQRLFVWDEVRQSRLIESIFLDIPVPSVFMATNSDYSWEVVDGLQRISTILRFVEPDIISVNGDEKHPLTLKGLEKIPSLNGARFDDLPKSLKLNFLTRPIRVTVLNDKSDYRVRFDLFERLNTGGIVLHDQEIRNCIFQGPFREFLKKCSSYPSLDSIIIRRDKHGRGNIEELILKFFAYYECRYEFKHSVKDFLNDYMEKKTDSFTNRNDLRKIFNNTFDTLERCLPSGIVRSKRPNSTPLILFEAVSIGVADILARGDEVDCQKLSKLLDDETLNKLTTGATNSQPKLISRINYVSERASV